MASILVVEDDEDVRRSIARMLANAGHAVIEAGGGAEGLALFLRHQPELIIVDILMPGVDGIEAILSIRRDAPKLPIVAISGGGATRSALFLEAALKLGADVAIGKPFRQRQLIAAVDQLLQRQA